MPNGKSILLIVGGGIAAYKALELVRLARRKGIAVTPILTKAGAEFVTPLSLAGLAGAKVYDDLFSLTDEVEMGHIALSRSADLVVVVPATADLIAKMANGIANDMASVTLLATDKDIVIAPAMNVRMWHHPATQRNLETLRRDGVTIVGPATGAMACGEFGPGRLVEPPELLAAIEAKLISCVPKPMPGQALAGKHVLVTSGPTHEPIDPVRYIANRSSGKQGHAIAAAAAAAGARVTLISGPTSLADPAGVTTVHVTTARQMLAATEAALPADIAIFAAAVADWRVANAADEKLKKTAGSGSGAPALALTENPDILATVAHLKAGRPACVVGFAAETEHVIANATAKFRRKGCDLLVANDVSLTGSGIAGGVFGGDANAVHLVSASGVVSWPVMGKDEVAAKLIAHLAALDSGWA
ncbi:MAG: bifunctional phosphopantothenoylcysteine decarboxylase/phosphopantothenate--cysteine ligase CoaBC [Hyphomicrobiales bacterium]|nr:bifunctional phosphopantothenoylcysteine decarboxylase/phosphopantothenate--cysteine ligase CoaBC [Hyphomicrobiales bacterium]